MAPRRVQSTDFVGQRSETLPRSHLRVDSQAPSEQQPQSNSLMHVDVTSGDETNDPIARKGRGPALGIKKWGKGGYKMHLTFNEHMQDCGENSKAFATRLGIIAKCGVRAPLEPCDWRKVSDTKKDAIWKEIKDNTDAPEEFKKLCLQKVGDNWRSWKSKVKKKFYAPNKDKPAALAIPPSDSRVKPTAWTELVKYWQREDVEEDANRNKDNREQSEFPHRTGRTSFADIRLQMMENGEDISRQNVFRRTRLKKTGGHAEEVEAALEQMNRKLKDVPESEHTPELLDKVFTEVMGRDGHGRVWTFGLGPTPTTFGSNSSSSDASSDRIQRMVDNKVDAKLGELERIHHDELAELERKRKEEIAEIERKRKEEITELQRNYKEDVAAEVLRQLKAHGILPSTNNLERGSPRVLSSSEVLMTSSDGSHEMCS